MKKKNTKEAHLFKLAHECSLQADYSGGGKYSIGCIAVYHGTVLAKGYNSDRTHTDQAKFNKLRYINRGQRYLPPKVHAEISVLAKIKYLDIDFSKIHLYIYREFKDGVTALAAPCPACRAAIRKMGIRYIHYTGNNSFITEKLNYIGE